MKRTCSVHLPCWEYIRMQRALVTGTVRRVETVTLRHQKGECIADALKRSGECR